MTEIERSKLRRLRGYKLSRQALVDIFSGHCGVELECGSLPGDASVVAVYDDPWSLSLIVTIQSDTFDAVPEGAEIPRMDERLRLVLKGAGAAEKSTNRPPLQGLAAIMPGRRFSI